MVEWTCLLQAAVAVTECPGVWYRVNCMQGESKDKRERERVVSNRF